MKDKEPLSSFDLKYGFYSLPFEDEASQDFSTFSTGNNLIPQQSKHGHGRNASKCIKLYEWLHLELLDRLFSRLQQADLQEGLAIRPENIRKVEKLRQPKTKKQVRGFLGATEYLRRCIPGYAKVAHLPNTPNQGEKENDALSGNERISIYKMREREKSTASSP